MAPVILIWAQGAHSSKSWEISSILHILERSISEKLLKERAKRLRLCMILLHLGWLWPPPNAQIALHTTMIGNCHRLQKCRTERSNMSTMELLKSLVAKYMMMFAFLTLQSIAIRQLVLKASNFWQWQKYLISISRVFSAFLHQIFRMKYQAC